MEVDGIEVNQKEPEEGGEEEKRRVKMASERMERNRDLKRKEGRSQNCHRALRRSTSLGEAKMVIGEEGDGR